MLTTHILQSQRDVAAQVPIDYVTQPGVVLASACFGHGRYKDDEAGNCLSNLLAVGYRRLMVDLYWDSGRQEWSLCPVSIPQSLLNSTSSLPSTATPTVSSGVLSSIQFQTGTQTTATALTVPVNGPISATTAKAKFVPTTLSNQTTPLSIGLVRTTSGLNGTAQPSLSTIPNPLNVPFYKIGPYSCTPTMTISTITTLLLDYIQKTQNTLEAQMLYVILNLHAAASASSPTESPLTVPESSLPTPSELVSTFFDASMSAFIYTPTNLRGDRANLNTSWYAVAREYQPFPRYYTTVVNPNGIHSTPDGWPSESYVEILKARRLLLGWGSVDTQMQGYNFVGDAGTIFPSGELYNSRFINGTSSNDLHGTCFFDANVTALVHTNSSWAVSSVAVPSTGSSEPLLNLSSNLTQCGISSIIDKTLFNTTANENVTAYQEAAYGAVWSWAPGEPQNNSLGSNGKNDNLFRCAIIDPNFNGRWRVDDCSSHYYAACRVASQPYMWQVTTYPVTYSSASDACPGNSTFAVPRTSLENTYLHSVLLDSRNPDAKNTIGDRGVWLNLNSLDVQDCWVSGGSNATCPYYLPDTSVQRRTVLVPLIAGIIVMVITALTLSVKCNANRRSSRRRRRGDAGWDYEGSVQSRLCYNETSIY